MQEEIHQQQGQGPQLVLPIIQNSHHQNCSHHPNILIPNKMINKPTLNP